MARQSPHKKSLFYEPGEKNDDATSGYDREGVNKTVAWKIYPEEGQSAVV